MNCAMCGSKATTRTKAIKKAKYRNEIVEVESEFFRCDACKEEFVTPGQMRNHVRAVKNEVRKKYGLLPPERIVEIREKVLRLTQAQLEEALGTGPKVVVRWESGKVIQPRPVDSLLRLLECDPSILKTLKQIENKRETEQKKYKGVHAEVAVRA